MLIRLLLALCLMAGFHPAEAAPRPNILVMGEDADAADSAGDTVVVGRDTRVFRQVHEALMQQIAQSGFAVYDERVITLDAFKQNRTGRSEAELLDIARTVQHPAIDDVVIFTIYAGARRLTYTTEVYARIVAHIVDARTGKRSGSFEVTSPKGWRAPVGCEGDCLVEVIGKSAEMMAGDLGHTLAEKLGAATASVKAEAKPAPPPDTAHEGYALVFDGFTPDDLMGVEDYLAAFQGYRKMRAIAGPGQSAYRYETDADSTQLTHDLRMMLDRLGTAGTITYAAQNGTFTIRKSGTTAHADKK